MKCWIDTHYTCGSVCEQRSMRLNASWFNGDARVHLRVRYEYMT